MKFNKLRLRGWVNPTIDSDALASQITMAGLEVDSIKLVTDSLHGVVVDEVVGCTQHPNADELRMIKVNVGGDHLLDIVCDTPNCHQGLRVVVATIGAVPPDNFKARATKLRGEPSERILCSLSELGISDDHNGIIELPVDTPINASIHEYLRLDDNTIEINMTPNYADCSDIIGVTRDVTVSNQLLLVESGVVPVGAVVDDMLPITTEAPNACPRYLGHVAKGINVKAPTPPWVKEELRCCGIRSVDVVADVTNYMLLGLGQPMHAFDKDRIEGGIVMRITKEGETLVLLGGTETKLDADTLAAADRSGILAMGGMFGDEHSGMNDETQSILLGCTFFGPLSVTSHAHRHGLHTDASHHYERGASPVLQHKAMEYATRLLIDICSDEAGPMIDITNKATLPRCATTTLRHSKLDHLIGHHIADEQVADTLCRFDCEMTEGKDEWQVIAPSQHPDMEIGEDLVERVVYAYGYNNVPDEPVQANLIMGAYREANLPLRRVKTLLNGKDYQEIIVYSFVDPKMQRITRPGVEALLLSGPTSVEASAMRPSLWTDLLATVVYNQDRQQSRVCIFESGLRFVPDTQTPLGIRQDLMLTGVTHGSRHEEHWDLAKETVDFYDLKDDLESVLDLIGKLNEVEFRVEASPILHPGQSVAIYLKGRHINFVGVVHPGLERRLGPSGRTLVFELE